MTGATLGKPGTITPDGAVVGRKPGQLITAGIVCILGSEVRTAKRHGWQVLNSPWAIWWNGKAMVERK